MAIWWIRRDLRLTDNLALQAAFEAGGAFVPVFVLDPTLLARPAERRQAFLFAGLRSLQADLRALGSGLVIRRGDPVQEIPRLAEELGGAPVFAEEDASPYARERDRAVGARATLSLLPGVGAHAFGAVVKNDGNPYTVFTPFSRAWKALPFPSPQAGKPLSLPALPALASGEIPALPAPAHFPAGEQEAQRRLESFLDGPIYAYRSQRDRMDLEGTSALSPYLRFGMLSPRQAAQAARAAMADARDEDSRAGAETWLNELIWREFYLSILWHFPQVLSESFVPAGKNIRWRAAPQDLADWQAGRTGYPVVDAGIRQLATTGWMHNRARMICASFLVKHLLINWQEGERWFMQQLIDGDPASNNGGWQWTAGTGTDAAPYFRVFNPVLQGLKFDPQGDYVRRWVPELAGVPDRYIHTPWEMPAELEGAARCRVGVDYPLPIVEHNLARARVLSVYQQAFQR
ncbi:MAG: deoxyribodipyrimidine photo-lyase [Chloroflexi bacterium]|nr:deoxyribodipyrimidine photo-lyase [Chloroflexota bacterium]